MKHPKITGKLYSNRPEWIDRSESGVDTNVEFVSIDKQGVVYKLLYKGTLLAQV
jgi:hypothetical protein